MTSSRMGSAGTPGLEVTWQSGQEEGQRPRLWHSIRTPAAMRLVPDSDRLAMYSGKVRTLGSRSRSSDSSEGEFPRKGGKEGHQGGLQAISKGMQGGQCPAIHPKERQCCPETLLYSYEVLVSSVGMKCSLVFRRGIRTESPLWTLPSGSFVSPCLSFPSPSSLPGTGMSHPCSRSPQEGASFM